MVSMSLKNTGNIVLVIGKTIGHLDQSIFAREILSEKNGPPPEVNLFNEKNNGLTVLKLINERLIESCHDISLGGIIVAISKMCIKSKKGIKLNQLKGLINKFNYFFGEDQARYLIEIRKENLNKVDKLLKENSAHYDELGYVIDNNIEFSDEIKLSVDEIEKTYKNWLRRYMVN